MSQESESLDLAELRVIDLLADQFEADWRAQRTPLIEEWLSRADERHRSRLLIELVGVELEWRAGQGDTLILAEYLQRFPAARSEIRAAFDAWGGPLSQSSQQQVETPRDLRATTVSLPVQPADGSRLGRYKLQRKLGSGSFGTVYQAWDDNLGRVVALKLLKPGSSEEARRRFLVEARAAGKLRHDNIVQIFDEGEIDGTLFISSELIDGADFLAARKQQPHSLQTLIGWIRDAARGLAHAHECGIVHRDVKPSNLLVAASGRVLVSDFGLARREDDHSSLTVEGAVVGTPSYMSPEQAAGRNALVGPLSDQFSLGVVLYEVLTGRTPFKGSVREVLTSIVNKEAPSPRRVNPKVPADLDAICQRAMTYERTLRYPNLDLMADDLERWLRGEPVSVRPVSRATRLWRKAQRRPVATALLLVLCLSTLTAATMGFIAWKQRDEVATTRSQLDSVTGTVAEKTQQLQRTTEELSSAKTNVVEMEGQVRAKSTEADRRRYHNLIRQIAENLERGTARVSVLQELLRQCPPELRDWEWHYLNHQLHSSSRVVLTGERPLRDAVLSPDGRSIVAIDMEGFLTVVSTADGRVLNSWFYGFENPVQIDWGRNGLIAAGGLGVGIVLRDPTVTNQRDPRLFPGEKDIAFDNDDFLYGSETAVLKFETPGLEAFVIKCLEQARRDKIAEDKRQRPDGAEPFEDENPFTRRRPPAEVIEFFKHLNPEALQRQFIPDLTSITLPYLDAEGFVVAFDADARRVAAGGDRFVQVWDIAAKKRIWLLPGHENSSVRAVEFSPDGTHLAAGMSKGEVIVWNLADAAEVVRKNVGESVEALDWSNNGEELFLTLGDGKVGSLALIDGLFFTAIDRHKTSVTALATSPDGKLCATASPDLSLRLWYAGSFEPAGTLYGLDSLPTRLQFTPDGSQLMTCTKSEVRLWDLPELSGPFRDVKIVVEGDARFDRYGYVDKFAIDPDGKWISFVHGYGYLTVRELATGRPALTQDYSFYQDAFQGGRGYDTALGEMVFDPQGRWFLASMAKEMFTVWELPGFKPLKLDLRARKIPDYVKFEKHAAVSSDGKFVAINSDRDGVYLIQTSDFSRKLSGFDRNLGRRGATPLSRMKFSPDGKSLAVATYENVVGLFDTETGKLIREWTGEIPPEDLVNHSRGGVLDIAFNSDGTLLAIAGDDSTITLWNPATGEVVGHLPGHAGSVRCVVFHPDGTRLISGSVDDTIRIWNVEDQLELMTLSNAVGNSSPSQLEFTRDGRKLVVCDDGRIRVFDAGEPGEPEPAPPPSNVKQPDAATDDEKAPPQPPPRGSSFFGPNP